MNRHYVYVNEDYVRVNDILFRSAEIQDEEAHRKVANLTFKLFAPYCLKKYGYIPQGRTDDA